MKREEYEDQYLIIYRELEEIREKQYELQCQQREKHRMEEDMEQDLQSLRNSRIELEDEWRSRNMIGRHEYIFEEKEQLIREIYNQRADILDDDAEMNEELKKLSDAEELCEEKTMRLRRDYENTKEEE